MANPEKFQYDTDITGAETVPVDFEKIAELESYREEINKQRIETLARIFMGQSVSNIGEYSEINSHTINEFNIYLHALLCPDSSTLPDLGRAIRRVNEMTKEYPGIERFIENSEE